MATYPSALYSPTTITDNVDYPLATHINTPNAEIVAIETELGTAPRGTATDVKTRLAVSLAGDGDLTLTGSSTLTIASGSITATNNLHKVAVESGSADNLDTVVAAADGYLLLLSCSDSSKPITIRHNVGNILCVGNRDILMSSDGDMVILVYSTALSKWRCNFSGKRRKAVATKTGTYTATANDDVLLGDATSAAFSITLPPATSSAGVELAFIKIDASANAVTLDGNASETINGATTKALSSQWDKAVIVCDGAAWFVIG